MDTLELYKFLQTSTGALNHIAATLYKGEISFEDALKQTTEALALMTKTLKNAQ
jgi:hypothetical protein